MTLPPLYLAPMAGVTDKPFRNMVRKFGQQTLFTEMIAVNSLLARHPGTVKLLDFTGEENLVVQLVGENPDKIAQAAKIVADNGAASIDINMGCPVKKLISNCSGAKLMLYPEKAAQIVEKTVAAVHVPVSVKMRLGWDKEHINGVEFAKILENAGAQRLTVHGRTKDQGYAGQADWQEISKIKHSVSIPVIANGDIVNRSTAKTAAVITSADGLMVGRGACGKPWVLSEIENGCRPEFNLSDLILEHFDAMLSYYGIHGVFVARKHLAWYGKGKKDVATFAQRVYAEKNIDKIKRMIKDFFDGQEA